MLCHIKSNNSGMATVKIVKNERDPPLYGKYDFYTMSYDNLNSVSQNVLKLY
jgi:hypothetical protein